MVKVPVLPPPAFDVHVASYLGKFLGRYPRFDLALQSGIAHHILGGVGYAAALFYFWVKGATTGDGKVRARVLSIFAALGLTILLAMVASKVVSWPPPSRAVFRLPAYLAENLNRNSFPSYSTAVYTAIAVGVYTLDALAGALLLMGIPLLIALPRMYVGGHYLTDILAGCFIGAAGFYVARAVLEECLTVRIERFFRHGRWSRIAGEIVVFIVIWQILVEFSELIWVKRAFPLLLR